MKPKIYTIPFAHVYALYITKAKKKGCGKADVDLIIKWLTDYSDKDLQHALAENPDFETFFANAPQLNPARSNITGVICGISVEDIEDKTTQEIRYLDKLIDELAKGKAMEKILRKNVAH